MSCFYGIFPRLKHFLFLYCKTTFFFNTLCSMILRIQKRVRGSTFKDKNFLDYMKHRTSSSTKPQSSKYQPYSSKMNQREYKDPFNQDTAPVIDKIPHHYSSSKQDNCSRGDSVHRSGRRNTYLNMMELNSDSYDHGHRRNVFRYKVSLYLGFWDSLTP